ncbi:hypothetical protein [Paractinoplanes durhamensis]|uniref:HEAT repeat domain-containing protein n=1 Tax=Paractinoplanes durhamensis TaxID=113563 RepID=A0ABQ3Z2K4_9ACTN|nr:hypothetical protein [Actinoplanes durhamensis]GIE04062.1 hypothetical protein Adu01nite_54120 [Actinoplanes durhamensis]
MLRKRAAGPDLTAAEEALPGIGEVRWSELRAGLRSAEVPRLLAALASMPDDGDFSSVHDELYASLAPNGLLLQVTPFAIPFLLRIARNSARRNAAFVAQLILETIAYGDPHADELAAGNARLFEAVSAELTEAVEFLHRQAASAAPRFRAQAIALLAPIDGRSPRYRRLLAAVAPAEDPMILEAVRDAEEYLADVHSGLRPPLPPANREPGGDREQAVEALARATDREAARWAAADLARLAVDDAVAVSPGAEHVVADVRRLVEDGCRWRADAFYVLIWALDHAYVWRAKRAEIRTYRGQYDASIAAEETVERALEGFDRTVREMLVDLDPETRSMACLLLARISGEPAADRELVLLVHDAETNALVRACAAEALRRLEDGAAPGLHERYLRPRAALPVDERWWPAEQY